MTDNFYRITYADIGKSSLLAFGKSWYVRHFAGQIRPTDVHKTVRRVGERIEIVGEETRAQHGC